MAAAPRGKVQITPAAPAEEKELQVVECLGVAKVPKGYVVVNVAVQGQKVNAQEVLSEPEPLAHAVARAQSLIVARYLKPKVGA